MTRELQAQLDGSRRTYGWDNASRIRFLREEIRDGKGNGPFLDEIRERSKALVDLFQVPSSCSHAVFAITDTEITRSGRQITGLRRVEIVNPDALPDASQMFEISLVRPEVKIENLLELESSGVLPPAFGEI